jgi:hypothetical protein
LAQCAAIPAGVNAFDSTGRLGLLYIAFPLKMMLQPDGHLTSCDILHTIAGAIRQSVAMHDAPRAAELRPRGLPVA